jgi:hypothetical protein
LEAEGLDHGRAEALLVLDLHGIERAPVRIDTDEAFLGGLEILEFFLWIRHNGLDIEG